MIVAPGSSRSCWRLCLACVADRCAAGGRPAAAQQAPTPGRSGIGDPYFPLDGNGGIDVLHYDVHDRYEFGSGGSPGWTTLDVRAPRTCRASTSTSCCRSGR